MHNIFPELSIVIAIGAGIALLMHVLRQPLIVGHILTGVVVGPAVFNIIQEESAYSTLSNLGIALLLFIIGLDVSLRVFSRLRHSIFISTAMQVVGISGLGFFTSRLLDFGRMESAILGLGLALSSTVIIVKLLNDKREITRLYAQITIGVLLLQDVVATAGKIGLAARSEGDSLAEILILLGRGIGVTLLLYIASRHIIPRLTRSIESSKELLLLFALGWGLGIATLFERTGFSIEIGALFAGVSLASLPYSREMAARLKPLRDFFLIIFFITLGQSLTAANARQVLGPAIILSGIVLLVKPIITMTSLGLMGYTKRTSFKSAISLSQVSEFSLVFAVSALHTHLASERVVFTLTLTALITFIVSAYLIKYDDWLYKRLEKRLRLFERRVTKLEQRETLQQYPVVMFGYRKGGREFIKTFKRLKKRFVVVDYDPEVIELLEREEHNYIYGDATDVELLDELNLDKSQLVVSVATDLHTNISLLTYLEKINPNVVFICSADNYEGAAELYGLGASYVMMPHYIGSEKISSFILRSGLKKTEFKKYREKHLNYIRGHFDIEMAGWTS